MIYPCGVGFASERFIGKRSVFYCTGFWKIGSGVLLLWRGREVRSAVPNDSVAQLVEHNTFNVGVLGSSPSGITWIQ